MVLWQTLATLYVLLVRTISLNQPFSFRLLFDFQQDLVHHSLLFILLGQIRTGKHDGLITLKVKQMTKLDVYLLWKTISECEATFDTCSGGAQFFKFVRFEARNLKVRENWWFVVCREKVIQVIQILLKNVRYFKGILRCDSNNATGSAGVMRLSTEQCLSLHLMGPFRMTRR